MFALHATQPLVRLAGRIRKGLSPWRRARGPRSILPRSRRGEVWSETWRSPESWVEVLQRRLLALGASVLPGGVWDRWDLEVRGGLFGGVRLHVAVEEHGEGRQLVRWRYRPRAFLPAVGFALALLAVAVAAAVDGAVIAAVILAVIAVGTGWLVVSHAAAAAGAARAATNPLVEVDAMPASRHLRGAALQPQSFPPLTAEQAAGFRAALEKVRPEDSRVARR